MRTQQGRGGFWILMTALLLFCTCSFLFAKDIWKSTRQEQMEAKGETQNLMSGEIVDSQAEYDEELENIETEQNDLWILFDNLKFARKDKKPSLSFYAVVLILYLLLLGPVSYFWLKKMDKLEYLWFYIPILAVLFSGSILFVNLKTQVKVPVVDTLTVLSPQKNDVVYVASTSPGKKSYELVFDSKVQDIFPLYMGGEYELYEDTLVKKNRSYTILSNKDTRILCLNPPHSFTRDYFKLTLYEKEEKEIELEQISVSGNIPEGSFTNTTDYTFPYMMFYYQDQFCIYDKIKPGETIVLKKTDWSSVYNQNTPNLTVKIDPDSNVRQLMYFFYEKYCMNGEADSIYAAGFIPEYKGIMDETNKDLVSKGVYYQCFLLSEQDENNDKK